MARNWPGFPGTGTWASWLTHPEFRELKQAALDERMERTLLADQDELRQVPGRLLAGEVPPAIANAYVTAHHRRTESNLGPP